jgi:hypothetical protein
LTHVGARGLLGPVVWTAIDRIIDAGVDEQRWRAHRLDLLAAHRLRATGREVPQQIIELERRWAAIALTAPFVLARARAASDGPMVLLKGPEVAARYPHPLTRPFWDLDLLVSDAAATQESLIVAGFVETGEAERYGDIHHLRPLRLPEFPVHVEVHSAPKWPYGIAPPPIEELLAAAVPSSIAVPGVGALPPEHHALLLAAHGWAHEPLSSLGDLIDVAAVASAGDPELMHRLAARWGISGIWRTTLAAVDAVLGPCRTRPLCVRIWARHLPSGRLRTPFEARLCRAVSGFWALPTERPLPALGAVARRRLQRTLGR